VKLGIKKGSATYQGLIALLSANNIPIERIKLVDVGVGVAPICQQQERHCRPMFGVWAAQNNNIVPIVVNRADCAS
jgi:hypothetical protein